MENIYEIVARQIDRLADGHVRWSACASREQMEAAFRGRLVLSLGIDKPVPSDWLAGVPGRAVLCLAGAGGLQAPLLAAAGARVTVLDLSQKMLEKDRRMAEQYGLSLRIEQGNMTDLSRFADGAFDCVINPVSLCYVPDVRPVFRECSRVLRPGGELLLAAPCPIAYVCDYVEDGNGGYYKAVNRMPYRSAAHPGQGDWVEFGHTMEDYLGGQLASGFAILGYAECQGEDITDLSFMTRAVRASAVP